MFKVDTNKVLETEHLLLRFLRNEDRHDLFVNIYNDKEVLRYFVIQYAEKEEDIDLSKSIEGAIKRNGYFFSIVLKQTNEVIGMILQCDVPNIYMNTTELGYALGKKYWNKGYASEALKAMIAFMFDLGIHKITACHFVENVASRKVMEKCGMKYEYRKIDDLYYHDEYHDTEYLYLLNDKL